MAWPGRLMELAGLGKRGSDGADLERQRQGLMLIYRGHSDVIYGQPGRPMGKLLASASGDKTVQEWNAADGKQVCMYEMQSFIHACVGIFHASEHLAGSYPH